MSPNQDQSDYESSSVSTISTDDNYETQQHYRSQRHLKAPLQDEQTLSNRDRTNKALILAVRQYGQKWKDPKARNLDLHHLAETQELWRCPHGGSKTRHTGQSLRNALRGIVKTRGAPGVTNSLQSLWDLGDKAVSPRYLEKLGLLEDNPEDTDLRDATSPSQHTDVTHQHTAPDFSRSNDGDRDWGSQEPKAVDARSDAGSDLPSASTEPDTTQAVTGNPDKEPTLGGRLKSSVLSTQNDHPSKASGPSEARRRGKGVTRLQPESVRSSVAENSPVSLEAQSLRVQWPGVPDEEQLRQSRTRKGHNQPIPQIRGRPSQAPTAASNIAAGRSHNVGEKRKLQACQPETDPPIGSEDATRSSKSAKRHAKSNAVPSPSREPATTTRTAVGCTEKSSIHDSILIPHSRLISGPGIFATSTDLPITHDVLKRSMRTIHSMVDVGLARETEQIGLSISDVACLAPSHGPQLQHLYDQYSSTAQIPIADVVSQLSTLDFTVGLVGVYIAFEHVLESWSVPSAAEFMDRGKAFYGPAYSCGDLHLQNFNTNLDTHLRRTWLSYIDTPAFQDARLAAPARQLAHNLGTLLQQHLAGQSEAQEPCSTTTAPSYEQNVLSMTDRLSSAVQAALTLRCKILTDRDTYQTIWPLAGTKYVPEEMEVDQSDATTFIAPLFPGLKMLHPSGQRVVVKARVKSVPAIS